MTLTPGTRLGGYEILSLIGAGGMGAVYRARDAKLGRDVALKVLPEVFPRDSERLARFEREARLLAALNHPNIATIHGFENAGGVHFLVMELVPGETLADHIARGPIDLAEALHFFRQIAEALEAAHERGVVHRDLKPANIKITPEGRSKVLDFGLAKALHGEMAAADPSMSPTITREGTEAGVILGTAAYMSPEQARGKRVDRRSDVWSFGVVFYEALTGRRAFAGETVSDTLAAILSRDVDWSQLPETTPASVRRLLRRSLQKDAGARLRDMGDARLEIEEALREPTPSASVERLRLRPVSRLLPWGIAAGLAVALLWILARGLSGIGAPVSKMVIPLVGPLGGGPRPAAVLSPDGRELAYVAQVEGKSQIYLRPLDGFEERALPGTEGSENLFFSPDGEWVGFSAAGKLKKVSVRGGLPVTVCETSDVVGASWGADDTIVFASGGPLHRVSANGGTPEPVSTFDPKQDGMGHFWPQVLPGGKKVLYTVDRGASFERAAIVLESLESHEKRILLEGGSYPLYVPTGHLLFARSGSLMAVRFNAERGEITGKPLLILDNVATHESFLSAQVAISRDGILAYVPRSTSRGRALVWVDRQGVVEPLLDAPRQYYMPRLSPEGRRLAVTIMEDGEYNVWIMELDRGTLSRLTFEGSNVEAIWSPDGQRIAFASIRGGNPNLFIQAADGTSAAERLTTTDALQLPNSWSPDGKWLAFTEKQPTGSEDVFVVAVEGNRVPLPMATTPFVEHAAAFSPDGKWLAFASFETGDVQVYVRPFPGPGPKWRVSGEKSAFSLWSRDGRELFFMSGERSEKMMVVEVETEPTFKTSKPRLLFEREFGGSIGLGLRLYDVTPDGKRFVFATSESDATPGRVHILFKGLAKLDRPDSRQD